MRSSHTFTHQKHLAECITFSIHFAYFEILLCNWPFTTRAHGVYELKFVSVSKLQTKSSFNGTMKRVHKCVLLHCHGDFCSCEWFMIMMAPIPWKLQVTHKTFCFHILIYSCKCWQHALIKSKISANFSKWRKKHKPVNCSSWSTA